mmetsp:Transcript_21180/g.31896  ORF Transcript_21180/g.31896 Transcript_21180/m.31896 type:complete len:92 (-) Transcript_21180:688-963(-)
MIVILYDDQREAYIPVYWILMTGKTEACYDQAFQLLNTDLGGKFNPSVVGIDFEKAFINMVKKHWPDAIIIGCFFHFKQAIRKYLIKVGIP